MMSIKTHLIFNPFFRFYYKIIVDSYAETWVICSNLILQKNTTEAKIPAKTGIIQYENRKEVTTRKRKSRQGALLFSYFQVTTSPRQVNEVATKKTWLRRKKLFKLEAEVAMPICGRGVDKLMKP